MKFTIKVQWQEGGEIWDETYDRQEISSLSEAEQWSRNLIDNFNETLHPLEKPRKLIAVSLSGASEGHDWEKEGSLGRYDVMRCKNCDVTGRRYGLNSNIKIDSKFRAKKHQKCHSTGN